MIKCKLSELLGKNKMHIRDLERRSGVSYHTLWALYHEKSTMVSLNTIDQICRALSIQVGDLFEYVEVEEKKGKETKPKKR
jgi:putative transcriptional regulator